MRTLILLFLICLAGLLSAQDNKEASARQNNITITTGYIQLKDKNLNPKIHSGVVLGVHYNHSEISKILSEFGAGFKVSLLSTVYESFPSSPGIQLLANYKYLFKIIDREKINLYFGPNSDLQFGTNAFFNWDESHLYWANYLSAGIGSRILYKAGKSQVGLSLDIPVFSEISRPVNNRQYKIDDMTLGGILKNLSGNLESAFPDKHFYLKAGVDVNIPTRGRRLYSFGYNFRYHYMKAIEGLPFKSIEHSLFYRFYF